MFDGAQAFGMADQQMTARPEPLRQMADQRLLRGPVEINHHVPAQNDVEQLAERIGRLEQIELMKPDALAQNVLHAELSRPFAHALLKMAAQQFLADVAAAGRRRKRRAPRFPARAWKCRWLRSARRSFRRAQNVRPDGWPASKAPRRWNTPRSRRGTARPFAGVLRAPTGKFFRGENQSASSPGKNACDWWKSGQ